ncbi:MAG: V4R domain-containing protein [Thermodesulfobacteriota bacterium]
MFFSPVFDSENNTIELNGTMVSLHCHHYNCGLLKAIEEIPGIDVHDIFIKTSSEEFYKNFKAHLANNENRYSVKNYLREASELYRFMGFGRIDLDNVGKEGGIAYADSSYFVVGWLAKYGRRRDPVCFLTCGFIAGILAAIFNVSPGDYTVRETECLVSGSDHCKFIISRN